MKDKNGNIDCENVVNCRNCTRCNNSTGCNNSTRCYNSTGCDNSTWCNNSAYCLFCDGLVLEKYCVFNKQVTKKEFDAVRQRVFDKLGWTHPKQLTPQDISWLKKNVKQFNKKVLDAVIANSILPDKPKKV